MLDRMRRDLPSLTESLGLHPLPERLRQAKMALAGADDVPKSRFDYTSLSILAPRLSIPLWRGRFKYPRRVILTNLFNHRQTPIEDGWSVRRTQIEDFRGRKLTYDSHNGTDLSIPRGTTMVAPAAGKVAKIFTEFNRGGLKLVLDHGEGLLTCSAHLARVLVDEGDLVQLGQPVAITGYSGLDGAATFPWGIPHVHFNVWLDGTPVDPFPRRGQASLWVNDEPTPAPESAPAADYLAPRFDAARVDAVIDSCKTEPVRMRLRGLEDLATRGLHLVTERNYYPTRFTDRGPVYETQHARRPRLHLPFSEADVDGADFFDEL